MSKTRSLLIFSLICHFLLCGFLNSVIAGMDDFFLSQFTEIYEPSGVVQLQTGEIIIIEDEPDAPLWVLIPRMQDGKLGLEIQNKIMLQNRGDDLEGISLGKNNDLFLITSHKKKGKVRQPQGPREMLIHLNVAGSNELEEKVERGLFQPLSEKIEAIEKEHQSINIEGLSFNSEKDTLLIGFRNPLYHEMAIILPLNNPYGLFEKSEPPVMGSPAALLELGGGIRAMSYDYIGGRYLIANEISANGRKEVALWSWRGEGNRVEKLDIAGLERIKNVEGLSIINWEKRNYLLLVCDDGNQNKKKGAHYLIISYPNIL